MGKIKFPNFAVHVLYFTHYSMKKFISLTFFLAVFTSAYSQDFSYSFDGQLDQASINKLESDCSKISTIRSAKVKYKEDSKKGEIILFLVENKNQRAELDDQFNPTDLKKILIESGLAPGEFRQVKK